MTAETYDVVVAGAGHNSLITAAYAARAGFRVLVLEANEQIGGDATSEPLTLPGFLHDSCASAHNLIQTNPMLRNNELQLDRHGLEYIRPDPVVVMPFLDGETLTMSLDLERTAAELARFSAHDANAYRSLLADWELMAPVVGDERANPPRLPSEVAARTEASPMGPAMERIRRCSALDVINERFKEPHVRAFFAWMAFMTVEAIDQPGSGLLAFSLVAGRQRSGWTTPRGGSIRLPLALAAVIEEAGGRVMTSKPVRRILLEGGRAVGVETADGSRFEGRRAVVSTIHVKHLLGMVGEQHLPAPFIDSINRWKPSIGMFATHYALSEAPRFGAGGGRESVAVAALESVDELCALLADERSGRIHLDEPVLLVITSSLVDASRAPAGHHTFKVVTFVPYDLQGGSQRWDDLKAEVSATLFEKLCRLSPNLSRRIVLAEHVESPLDMERRNPANWHGSCHGGAATPDQTGYFRPAAGWSSYRTPIEGLYQTGACTHPGGSISGLPGRNCASVLLGDLGSSLNEVIGIKSLAAKP